LKTSSRYVVDTHALVWSIAGDARLGTDARAILSDPKSELILPTIVLAEAYWVIEHGRTNIPSVTDFLNAINADSRITVVPLDRVILDQTLTLTVINEMHDRQIVATVLALIDQGESVALLTRDQNICDSSLVPVIW
jgi:PIN domain nuclease of toxin-antitoxin system